MARPIPEPPPVMTATFPLRLNKGALEYYTLRLKSTKAVYFNGKVSRGSASGGVAGLLEEGGHAKQDGCGHDADAKRQTNHRRDELNESRFRFHKLPATFISTSHARDSAPCAGGEPAKIQTVCPIIHT